MKTTMWKTTYWTFQQSSELGGGVVREGEKKSREREAGRRKEGGDKTKNKAQFEEAIHIGQESTSKITES